MMDDIKMLRFKMTHTGTSGGEVTSWGVLMHDGQVALDCRYGAHTDGSSLEVFSGVFDMIRKIGQFGECAMVFVDPAPEE